MPFHETYHAGLPLAPLRAILGSVAALALISLAFEATSTPSTAKTINVDQGLQAQADKPTVIADTSIAETTITASPLESENTIMTDVPSGPVVLNRAVRQETVTVRRGQTLSDTLEAAGIKNRTAYLAVASLKGYFDPRKLKTGQSIELQWGPGEDALTRLSIRTAFDQKVTTQFDGENWSAGFETLETIRVTDLRAGTITDNLFMSAERAGLPTQTIVDMIRMFSFDVDFQREIRAGDAFEVYFERRMLPDGSEVETGDILYAKLTLRGREMVLYRFTPTDDGRTDYFAADGSSARKALMKTPVDGARLSSTFGTRKHPVLGYTRAHKGVDFATGGYGAPIMAAGDGVVVKAERWGSFGNYVRIRHNDTYETAYAHLGKYGQNIKKGARIKQGDIIGYIGATGRVTGPHLHYEVLVNGKQVNPLTLTMPTGRKLDGEILFAFTSTRDAIMAEVERLKAATILTGAGQ